MNINKTMNNNQQSQDDRYQGALSQPSSLLNGTQTDEDLLEELSQQYGEGQPSLNVINPSEAYGDTADIKPVEHEHLPTLQILNNQDCAKPWSGLYE